MAGRIKTKKAPHGLSVHQLAVEADSLDVDDTSAAGLQVWEFP
jgi:hypothetical protein